MATRVRTKGRKKLTRSGREKARYTARYNITARNKARRANKRDKQKALFRASESTSKPLGSPSQIRMRHRTKAFRAFIARNTE